MSQDKLDPETMERLINSSAWQAYLRDFLLPTFALAVARYDGTPDDHRFWQGWKLALKVAIESPYQRTGRQGPLDLRWDAEPRPPQERPLVIQENPAESTSVQQRPIRRTTFPV